MTDHAELIERALAAVEADRADLARGHDGRSCLRQSEGAALAAALAAETERADWNGAKVNALMPYQNRALAAEAREAALREALEEIESFPISGYHAGAAQRIAREALARTAGEQPPPR
jgi:hypothetical protein